jgi:predicted nucleotidyltransferase
MANAQQDNIDDENIRIVQEYLNKFEIEWKETKMASHGQLVLNTITGSRLYDTYDLSTSDVDIVSVYSCPIIYFLGLDEVKSKHCVPVLTNNKAIPRSEQTIEELQSVKLDYLAYELSRFCNMMIQGNPIALEILSILTSRLELCKVEMSLWEPLIEKIVNTNALITQELVMAYESYANGQYKQAINLMGTAGYYDERSSKAMYHAIRVILEAIHVATNATGPRIVHEAEYIELMKQIKLRKLSFEETEQLFKDHVQKLNSIKQQKVYLELPKTVSNHTREVIHQWLVSIRLANSTVEF